MKKKKLLLTTSVILLPLLASCGDTPNENVITNDDLAKGVTTYKDKSGAEKQLNRNTLYTNAGTPHVESHPTNGKKQKLLVAPIKFTKDRADNKDTINADDALYENIRLAFNGTKEEMAGKGFTSVSEFYEESSYGKGAFDAVLLPSWVDLGMTAKEFREKSGGNGGVYASNLVRDWYIKEYDKTNHGSLGADAEPITYFDSDNDGFIDLMWNVYAYPYDNNTSSDNMFWWAYVTYTGNKPNKAAPTVQTLGWASTNFMKSSCDPHTFIHETGHTLGLDDYYDYNKTWKPMASVDYMDQNLGDHNSFSKFQYGWVNPWVLKEEDLIGGKTAEITLGDAVTTGDCLVLASPNYNMTAFDEYFMVELVGPYGLAKNDYLNGYEGTTGFTAPGVRVLHVDARAQGSAGPSADRLTRDFLTADDVGQNAKDLRIGNSYLGRQGLTIDGDFYPIKNGNSVIKRSFSEVSMMMSSGWTSGNSWMNSTSYNAKNDALFTTNHTFTLTGENNALAKEFMPSQSNLWNKSKVVKSGNGENQKYTIDESITCNFKMRVGKIETTDTGAKVTLKITLA